MSLCEGHDFPAVLCGCDVLHTGVHRGGVCTFLPAQVRSHSTTTRRRHFQQAFRRVCCSLLHNLRQTTRLRARSASFRRPVSSLVIENGSQIAISAPPARLLYELLTSRRVVSVRTYAFTWRLKPPRCRNIADQKRNGGGNRFNTHS